MLYYDGTCDQVLTCAVQGPGTCDQVLVYVVWWWEIGRCDGGTSDTVVTFHTAISASLFLSDF